MVQNIAKDFSTPAPALLIIVAIALRSYINFDLGIDLITTKKNIFNTVMVRGPIKFLFLRSYNV